MDRLTAWDKGHAYYKKCFEEPCLGCGCEIEDCQLKIDICNNLARYEDLGITSDQIREIDKLYLEKCEEVNLLKKQLEVSQKGDLISRKTLLDRLAENFQNINYHPDFGDPAAGMEQELFNDFLYDMIKLVEEQPTSYDVEKVVDALENQIELNVTRYPVHGKYIKKNMAIKIVKTGGADE